MTPEEQRIAIAEACGWKTPNPRHYTKSTPVHPLWKHRPEWDGVKHSATSSPVAIPDYLNDLNAMAQAEATVPYKLQPVLVDKLKRFVMRYEEGVSDWDVYTATADQRAEAFLRTIGKWKEEA